MRRLMLNSETEENDVKEWQLVADVTVAEGATQVKVPVDNYKEYIIYGNIVSQGSSALRVSANREGYDWASNRIISLDNGVNNNASKRFYLNIKKISELYIEVNSAASFEGVAPQTKSLYMKDIDVQALGTIEYFYFSTQNSSVFTGGNIKVFAR